ncbi:hypothetical protein D3C80_1005620 [compost metagenome]
MVQHRCRHAGFFDHAVAVQQRTDPAQIQRIRFDRPAAHHHAGIGGVIGNGVEHLARTLSFRIDVMAARIDDFQSRDDVIGSVVNVEQRAVRSAQRFGQHKCQFNLDARHDKAIDRNITAVVEKHVVQQRAKIRLSDLRTDLHGA